MLIVNLGPLVGLSFGEDQAAVVTEQIDKLMTAVLALIAMWGRVSASSTLVLGKPNNTVNSPWIVSALAVAAVLLAGCLPTGGTNGTPQTASQSYYAAKSSYALAVEEAAGYAALPFCDDVIIVGCADPVMVIKLDNAVDSASAAFETADIVFESATQDPVSQADALSTATVALRALTAILATAVVREAAS